MQTIAKVPTHEHEGPSVFQNDVYHNQRIDENNMGQVHSEMNVYQIQCCPNIGDYDIFYGNTQMLCAYCDVD